MARFRIPLVLLALTLACEEDDKSPPPPVGGTGNITGSAPSAGGGSATVTGTGGGTVGSTGTGGTDTTVGSSGTGAPSGCDPLGDPATECAQGQECSFVDRECYPSTGTGVLGDPCQVTDSALLLDSCAPSLVCAFTDSDAPRCVAPCNVGTPCSGMSSCIAFEGSIPGMCLAPCDGLQQMCDDPSFGCYPLPDVAGAFATACLPAGTSAAEEPCTVENDCLGGLTCTDDSEHTSLCDGAARCCAQLCDVSAGNCAGLDPTCGDFMIPESPNLGVCVNPSA